MASFRAVSLDQNAVIRLSGISPEHQAWLVDRIDRRVKLSGQWTGTHLALDVESARLEEPPQSSFVSAEVPASSVRPATPHRRYSSQAHAIESGLKGEGALLSLWAPPGKDGNEITFAIATDVELVHRMLDPIYGESLQVVKSRWSFETLDSLRQVFLKASTGVVLGLGESHTSDHQLQIRARLRYLSRDLAELLSQYPSEMLDLTVYVLPAESENYA